MITLSSNPFNDHHIMGFRNIKWMLNPEKFYAISYNAKELYYTQFFDIVDISKLIQDPATNFEDFSFTNIDIQFLNVPFTATSKKLVKLLGRPHYLKVYDSSSSSCDIKIYFYKKRFFRNKVIVQFYFIRDIFAYCIVTFLTLNPADEKKLLTILNGKYLDPKDASQQVTSIQDKNGYYVYYEKLFYSSLIYINNSLRIKEAISDEDKKLLHSKKWENHYNEWRDFL